MELSNKILMEFFELSTFCANFVAENKSNTIMAEEKYNRIKVALAERDHSNKWLAQKLGKTEMTVSRWASNKSQPSLEQLFEIAKALDMDARYLIHSSKDIAAGSLDDTSKLD